MAAKSKVRRVCWDWEEWLQASYFTPEELYLFCIAEANEKYRNGESPIEDSEYDYLCSISDAHELTHTIGTGLTCGLVLFYLGHTQEHTYMSKQVSRRSASTPAPKPKEPAAFEQLLNDYTQYKKDHWDNPAVPEDIPYNQHRIKHTRAWDAEAKKMDYEVKVVDGKILLPAEADDDVSTWTPEETAIIAGKYYYAMDLDNYFVLMDDADVHDRHGVWLYEGDIVEDSKGDTYIVVFDRHWRRWVLALQHAISWTPMTLGISANYAVVTTLVGNIYQHMDKFKQRTVTCQ